MRIIKPITITDSTLTSTNVLDVAPDLYDSGVTYSKGDFVHIVNGTALDIYESLYDSNLNNDPATTEWWIYRSSTYPEYLSSETYALGDVVIRTSDHKKYESLQDSNTGNDLDTATTYWIEAGATNAWTAFDKKIGSQTLRTGEVKYVIAPGGIIEKIAFFNMDCSSISISISDPTDGLVFEQEIKMISTSNVYDAYSYCFAPFLTIKNTVSLDTPPYSNPVISITINGGSDIDEVGVGTIVLGKTSYIGETQYSPTIEIIDYSIKDPDDYGNIDVVERAFSRRISVDIYVENSLVGFILDELETYRATPVAWVTTEASVALQNPYLIYGFYKGFSTVAEYISHSLESIEIESLV